MQSLSVPSFFRALTIPAAYRLELILITSFPNIVRSCAQTFDFNASGVRLDRMLTDGLSPVLIKSFTSTARPRFPSLLENRFLCSNSYSCWRKIRRCSGSRWQTSNSLMVETISSSLSIVNC